VGQDLKPDPPE